MDTYNFRKIKSSSKPGLHYFYEPEKNFRQLAHPRTGKKWMDCLGLQPDGWVYNDKIKDFVEDRYFDDSKAPRQPRTPWKISWSTRNLNKWYFFYRWNI